MSVHFNFGMKMFKLHDVLCLFVVFCECAFYVKSVPCRGTASYKLQFQAEWKNTSRPAGAGFSGLIGCSHNKCYRMWREGERASLGVRNVAEKGDDTELSNEIQKHIEKWKTVSERLQTMNNTIGPEDYIQLPKDDQSGFTVDSSRPLVSVIAKIIPSPDWFIGVQDVSLCNTSGEWLHMKVIPLFPYDAGIAQKSKLNDSIVVPTNPRQDIQKTDEIISDPVRGMGYIRFFRISENLSGSSHVVIDEDNCPNIAALREMSLLLWCILFATMVLM